MGDDFERVLCHKREVFVFRLPPKTSNRGYRLLSRMNYFLNYLNYLVITTITKIVIY